MGFGIVNTVLMAVYERMREFGLLRALGMKTSGIFKMVLTETVLLIFYRSDCREYRRLSAHLVLVGKWA